MAPEPALMTFTLDQVLALVGSLDDSAGYDAPRERFRRFLTDRVKDIQIARALIEQCQRTPVEQHRRALQDLTVWLGRFLGFEPTFGSYERTGRTVRSDGQWQSRRRLHVVLGIMNDEVARGAFDGLARALEASAGSTREREAPRLGLAVITPLHAGGRTDEIASTEKRHPDLRVASLRSIIWLAEMVGTGAFRHEQVVKLLLAAFAIDVVVELLQPAVGNRVADAAVHAAPAPAPPSLEPAFWLAAIVRDGMTTAEQFVQAVVVKRHIMGVVDAATLPAAPRPGDSICLFVREKGVVGQAQVVSVFEGGVELIRGSDRFNRMIRLRNIEVFDEPLPPATALDLPETRGDEHLGPVLVPLSRQQFVELTTPANS